VNLYYAKAQYPDFKVVQEMQTDEHYGIAVHLENKGLLDAINVALKAIRNDGTYDKLYAKWFGTAP
jgi:polar amino acid transport system substrate-binding protein